MLPCSACQGAFVGWDGEVEAGGDGVMISPHLMGGTKKTAASEDPIDNTTMKMSGARNERRAGLNSPITKSAAASSPSKTRTAGPNVHTA